MISIAQAVEQIMRQKPILLDFLYSGVVNYSALGRSIRSEVEHITMKDVSDEAVMMALKRMKKPELIQLKKLFHTIPVITVRSNLVEVTVRNSSLDAAQHEKISKKLISQSAQVFIATRSMYETTYILPEDLLPELQAVFNDVVSQFTGLAAISIHLPEETVTTRGVYYQLLQALAWEGVNVIEVASTYREFTIIVRNEDVDTAFSVLKKRVQH